MHLYFTDSMVPELSRLTARERRLACEQAVRMLKHGARIFRNLPVLLCCVGGVAGSIAVINLGEVMSRLDMPSQILFCLGGVAVGGAIGGFCGRHVQFWMLRPHLRSIIQESPVN
jgi:hypothetical protein